MREREKEKEKEREREKKKEKEKEKETGSPHTLHNLSLRDLRPPCLAAALHRC